MTGALIVWAARFFVMWFAWSVARRLFQMSSNHKRTARKAAAAVVGVAGFAALMAGQASDPDCDPDPLYGGCDTIQAYPVNASDRFDRGIIIFLLIAPPVLAAGIYENRRGA
jgi:hypothetical protein